MTSAIISGAAGFIGSNFLHQSVNDSWFDQILVIDKLTYAGRLDNIPKSDSIEFRKSDLSEITIDELNSFDFYYNFAAESHVDNSLKNPLQFGESNFISVLKLLEKLKIASNDNLRLVHISTDEVYGSINEGSFSESDRLFPRNPYSATKAAADLLINAYLETYDLDIIITRSSNNYGPRQHTEKLIPKSVTNFLNKVPIKLYGDGNQIRDWTYVGDNCRGIKMVGDKGKSGQIYNISANNELRNNEIIDKLAELMNVNFTYKEFIADRLGHDQRYSIETEKIRNLGWKPEIDIEQGLKDTVDYFLRDHKTV